MNISQWDPAIWAFVLTWAAAVVAAIALVIRDTDRPGGDH